MQTSDILPLTDCIREAAAAAKEADDLVLLMYDVVFQLWTWEIMSTEPYSDEPVLVVLPDGSVHPADRCPEVPIEVTVEDDPLYKLGYDRQPDEPADAG